TACDAPPWDPLRRSRAPVALRDSRARSQLSAHRLPVGARAFAARQARSFLASARSARAPLPRAARRLALRRAPGVPPGSATRLAPLRRLASDRTARGGPRSGREVAARREHRRDRALSARIPSPVLRRALRLRRGALPDRRSDGKPAGHATALPGDDR